MKSSIETTATKVLAWRVAGIVDDAWVVAWADARLGDVADAPSWLVDLSLKGPKRYLAERGRTDPGPAALDLHEAFAARAEVVARDSAASVDALARWLVSAAIGRDLADPLVAEAYAIDHLLSDLDDDAGARARVLALVDDPTYALHPLADAVAGG